MLRALYVEQGLSKKAIARQLGCSDATVAAAVRHFQLARSGHLKISEQDRRTIMELYERDRLPVRAIAARTGLGREAVLDVLRAGDVPLRGRGARTAERLDPEALRRAYEAGASLRALALAAGTDDGVIRGILIDTGVTVRGRGRIAKWQDVLTAPFLVQMHIVEQQSLSAIAQQVGCGYQTVLDAVHRHGIQLQGRRDRPTRSP